jgi:uncharacterized protein (DUF1800 family)
MIRRTLLTIPVLALTLVLNVSGSGAAPATPVAALTETDRIVHLLNRAGYGPRLGDVEKVRVKGFARYIEEQLRPELIDDLAMVRQLALFDTLTSDAATLRARYQRDPRPVIEQLQGQKIIRAISSERQLQEVMVDFWFNHFNVDASKDGVQFVTTGYERDAIRPHALGKFKDLLFATAKHPAMLLYLDNAKSSSKGINENYARELMELHTLGVDGGFLQKDVVEVARVFTGWTTDAAGNTFEFRESLHVPGNKVVLEQTIPSGGIKEGEAVLELLTRSPSTARFIATKLVRRFVADNPPATLVNKVARVFIDTDGDIRAMVRTILNSPEFVAPEVVGSKMKSPFEAIVSSMRAVNATLLDSIDDRSLQGNLRGLPPGDIVLTKSGRASLRVSPAIVITRVIQEMGQFAYQNPEPTGYPDRSDYWMNSWSLLRRMNFAVSLVNNQVLGTTVDVDLLDGLLRNEPPTKDTWKAALNIAKAPASPSKSPAKDGTRRPEALAAVVDAFALALGSPEFQNR